MCLQHAKENVPSVVLYLGEVAVLQLWITRVSLGVRGGMVPDNSPKHSKGTELWRSQFRGF